MAANNKQSNAAAFTSDYLDSKARYVPDEFDGDRQFATTGAWPRHPALLHAARIATRQCRIGGAYRHGKATISRFTYTLTRLGYLRVNRMNNKFQLGSAVLSLSYPLLASMSVRQIARPSMKELADQIRGSVSLGMPAGSMSCIWKAAVAATPLGVAADIGLSYPIVRPRWARAARALPAERREALCNKIAVKSPNEWNTSASAYEQHRYSTSADFACPTATCVRESTPSPCR